MAEISSIRRKTLFNYSTITNTITRYGQNLYLYHLALQCICRFIKISGDEILSVIGNRNKILYVLFAFARIRITKKILFYYDGKQTSILFCEKRIFLDIFISFCKTNRKANKSIKFITFLSLLSRFIVREHLLID